MRFSSPRLLAVVAAGLVLSLCAVASADTVGRNYSGYQKISKGVFDLGIESLVLFSSTSTPILDANDAEIGTNSVSNLSTTVGVTPRYFLADNFGLGLNVNFFLNQASATTEIDGQDPAEASNSDSGVIGYAMANYYLRLGNSFFFKPGLGVGGFAGTRSVPDPEDAAKTIQSSLAGFAARLDLGFVFYAGRSFNLKAGPDIIFKSGSETPQAQGDEEVTALGFTTIEAGFNIGLGYSF